MKTDKIDAFEGEGRRRFMRTLLGDLRALERMLKEGMLEGDPQRIGAEQEMFLVNRALRPAPGALQMLERLEDPHFTTELGLFNLELNLEPEIYGGDCLSRLERQLDERLAQAHSVAAALGLEIVLTGILPTIRKSDLGLDMMVPNPRYRTLNRVMSEMRGGAYQIHIKGLDEILVKHDSVMVEACNASFQIHLQVGIPEFANHYNIAQALAGPVLAAATNSPLLFGRRLWSETRIALFQQSVDTRSATDDLRELHPRVMFGNRWMKESVLEIYREDIARFRTLVGTESDEDPNAKLDQGIAPALSALRLHNGTIYRWNRACYGITNGKPHLRIENRVFPSGPSVVDEIANGALWLGLMTELAARYDDITKVIEFDHARLNFTNAARQGLGAQITWLEGEEISAQALVLERLLPLAEEGLARRKVDADDRRRYLSVIERRVRSGRSGSRWLLSSLSSLKEKGTSEERLHALVAATVARQADKLPVCDWEPARLEEAGGFRDNYVRVEQFMTTDLVTVHEDDSIDLVANLMEWERVRHVLVEDQANRFVGLVSYRSVLRLLARGELRSAPAPIAVAEVMKRDAITIPPDMSTLDAIALMRTHRVACLPVLQEGRLIGVVTEADFLGIAGGLLEQKLHA